MVVTPGLVPVGVPSGLVVVATVVATVVGLTVTGRRLLDTPDSESRNGLLGIWKDILYLSDPVLDRRQEGRESYTSLRFKDTFSKIYTYFIF